MERLGGIDASFLYFETPETPMHVAGFTLYDLPEGYEGSFYERFRDLMASRLHMLPVFRKKLAAAPLDLHHPAWVDDPNFDINNHVLRMQVPAPGTPSQVEELIARLHSQPMDRNKPMWQFIVLEGLQNGQVALYSKVHHAAVDGGAGMIITQMIYDVTPVPRKVEPPKETAQPQAPNPAGALGDLVNSMVRFQLDMLRKGPEMMGTIANMFFPQIGKDQPLSSYLPQSPIKEMPKLLAPKTIFNVAISGERSYAARSLPLDTAKLIGKASGAKLNEVVMATCSGALRRYLLEKNALPAEPLIAFVPISLRELGNTDINNQVFGMMCSLASDVAKPLERLEAVKQASKESKQVASAVKGLMPQDYAFFGAPVLLRGLSDLFGRSGLADVLPMPCNVAISNVPGPQVPLYGAGAKVAALYPVSIATHGCALNITVQSYLGKLEFGLTADKRAVPDVAKIGDYMVEAFAELGNALVSKPS